jgi:hypothetical protein
VILAVGPVSQATASASGGLGLSVQREKANIAVFDPHAHWAKPVKTGSITDYDGTGDGGRASYDLATLGGALYEVEGTIQSSTEAQGVKLGEIQDALTVPFAGKREVAWFDNQVQLVQAGAQPKATKVFGNVRVGLGFTVTGSAVVLNVSVLPTNV